MAVAKRFEELRTWQAARALAKATYAATRQGSLANDWALRDQMNRSALSVAANIAEGYERGTRAEFAQFLSIAKGSCGELRSHLHIAYDRGHLPTAVYQQAVADCEEVSRLLAAFRQSLRSNSRRAQRPPLDAAEE